MKKILITGGTSGIGEQLVKLLSEEYEVIFTYKNNYNKAKEIVNGISCFFAIFLFPP